MINELAKQINENAIDKGFYDNPPSIAERIALIHAEASEALEADREDRFCKRPEYNPISSILDYDDYFFKHVFLEGVKDSFEDELADIVIRVFDLAAYKNIDIESHIKAKMRYNLMRPKMHGGKKY